MNWDDAPQSVADWIALGRRHQDGARDLKKAKQFSLVWDHTGYAVECYLKAAIMKQKGWNRWPEARERRDLWCHECKPLLEELGVSLQGMARHPLAPKLSILLTWRRRHGYNPHPLPERYAEQIYDAAFSAEGVVEWIATTYRLPC